MGDTILNRSFITIIWETQYQRRRDKTNNMGNTILN
jgi:hypothetical protein